MAEGFQLNVSEISEGIIEDISQRNWSGTLRVYYDTYKHPDKHGIAWVHTAVDLGVVTFVGSREQAQAVMNAAAEALGY